MATFLHVIAISTNYLCFLNVYYLGTRDLFRHTGPQLTHNSQVLKVITGVI